MVISCLQLLSKSFIFFERKFLNNKVIIIQGYKLYFVVSVPNYSLNFLIAQMRYFTL